MDTVGKKGRCKGRTRAGRPCRAAATAGGLCFFHANPNKASELGKIGGRSRRHFTDETANPLPTLDSAIAVRDLGTKLIADVYSGKLSARIASGLVPLLNLQLRAIEIAEGEQLARRLAELEKRLAIASGQGIDAEILRRDAESEDGRVNLA